MQNIELSKLIPEGKWQSKVNSDHTLIMKLLLDLSLSFLIVFSCISTVMRMSCYVVPICKTIFFFFCCVFKSLQFLFVYGLIFVFFFFYLSPMFSSVSYSIFFAFFLFFFLKSIFFSFSFDYIWFGYFSGFPS